MEERINLPIDKNESENITPPTVADDKLEMEVEKIRRDFYIELALLLILGILIGVAIKTEASKRITIGFNDYKMKIGITHYNINELQSELIKKQSAAVSSDSQEGGACSIN